MMRLSETMDLLMKIKDEKKKKQPVEGLLNELLRKYEMLMEDKTDIKIPQELIDHVDEGLEPDQYGQYQLFHRLLTLDEDKQRKVGFLKASQYLQKHNKRI